jgi:hypothetical protein
MKRYVPHPDPVVQAALSDLARAASDVDAEWALIGGHALRAYGVPRETLDADALVPLERAMSLADKLVEKFNWIPIVYDANADDFVEADEPLFQYMDDPVLYDIGEQRSMIMLQTPQGLPVDILGAQHPVELIMLEEAARTVSYGRDVPVAPLGGVLLVKTKAGRLKDDAAIEQAAEHLPAATLRAAVAWAEREDFATGEDLAALIRVARTRLAPNRTGRSSEAQRLVGEPPPRRPRRFRN